tara:strand:- start:619 stop:1062 length:444 start_codon:yes stop_codon:yes gene_type:complete
VRWRDKGGHCPASGAGFFVSFRIKAKFIAISPSFALFLLVLRGRPHGSARFYIMKPLLLFVAGAFLLLLLASPCLAEFQSIGKVSPGIGPEVYLRFDPTVEFRFVRTSVSAPEFVIGVRGDDLSNLDIPSASALVIVDGNVVEFNQV